MSLQPGTRLGHHEIVVPLGAGGMGEVFRATDTALGRGVALKVLPAALARDAELLAIRPDFAATSREEPGKWFQPDIVERYVDGLRKAGLDFT